MTESDSNTEFFPGGSLDLSTFTRAFEATVTEDDGFGRISVATSAVTHTSSFVFDDAQRIIGWNFSGTTTGATGYGQSQVDGPPYIRSLVNAQATQGFRFRATEPGTFLVATGEHVVAGELSCVEVRVQVRPRRGRHALRSTAVRGDRPQRGARAHHREAGAAGL